MDLVTTDVETYYDSDYTLNKMTAEEYIRDPRFELVGVSGKLNDQPRIAHFTDSKKELREWYLDNFPLNAAWVGHNMSGFDSLVLTHHLDLRPKIWQCTLAMGRLHHGNQSVSLAKLAELYGLQAKGTYVDNMKGLHYRDLTPAQVKKYSVYCGDDTDICYQLYQLMLPKTPAEELRLIHLFIRMFAEPRLVLDEHGLRLYHKAVLDKQRDTLLSAAKAIGIEIKKPGSLFDTGPTVEEQMAVVKKALRSDAKFAALLDAYGVEPPRKVSPKTGKEAYAFAKTDKAMTELLDHDTPEVATLAAARLGTKSTIEESRVTRFIGIAERGPLPALFLYGKTHTHRGAGGGKTNLQNMSRSKSILLTGEHRTPTNTLIYTPDGAAYLAKRNAAAKLIATTEGKVYPAKKCGVYGLRHGLLAPPGYKIVVSDSANIELRVAHLFAGQMDVVERLRRDEDLYAWFAGQLYGYEVNKKQHPLERNHGKVGMLQLQYQSGWRGFINAARSMFKLKLNQAQGEETVLLYRSLFPHIVAMWKRCNHAINAMAAGERFEIDQWGLCYTEHNAIVLPNGTRLQYYNLRKQANPDDGRMEWVYDDKENRATRKLYGGKVFENLCQALARIVVFTQKLRIEKRWAGPDTGVVLTSHDEVGTVVRDEDADECLAHSLETMRTPPKWWPDLPLDAEGDIAQSYGAAK